MEELVPRVCQIGDACVRLKRRRLCRSRFLYACANPTTSVLDLHMRNQFTIRGEPYAPKAANIISHMLRRVVCEGREQHVEEESRNSCRGIGWKVLFLAHRSDEIQREIMIIHLQ